MNKMALVKKVNEIAREAGKAILDIYDQQDDFRVEIKSDRSPLTTADKAANQIICEGLSELVEAYPVISEENKELPYEQRRHFEYCWLVDPLDGTKEFLKRNGEFTVNIALIYRHYPILGVVYAPCLGELYWAVKEGGAYFEKDGVEELLRANPFHLTDSHLGVVCSRSHLNSGTEAFIGLLKEPSLVAKGSSLKFMILAKGGAEVYPRLAPTMEWDTAAAQIILEESGGQVLNYATKKALVYNKENLLNPHFVAYAKILT